jgi:hypothetical protein
VVRASYRAGKDPIWVKLEGIEPTGFEHHFYTQAHKYTGIFWPVDEERAKSLQALRLFSVDKFKAAPTTTLIKSEPVPFQGRDQRPRPLTDQ